MTERRDSPRHVVVGGSVASLVAADQLARSGARVRLLLPERGVGGGFLPLERDGRNLDRGMRVLELRYEGVPGTPPPLREYVPGEQGHRPWVTLVDAWARELVGSDAVVELDPAACYSEGRLGPEILLSSDASGAPSLVGPAIAAAVAEEAQQAVREHGEAGLLAAGRHDELWRTDLVDASRRQHGPTFSRTLLEPFCRKIRPSGGVGVPAALRRKLWVPLFWPRTLAEAFGAGEVAFRPDRPLSTVRPGGPGALLQALLARLQADPHVDVVRYGAVERVEPDAATATAVRLRLSDGRVERAAVPVLGLAPGELFAAAGVVYAPHRAHSVLVWLEVAEADLQALPGFVHVLDPDVPAYRITPGERDDAGRRVLCVELAHDVAQDVAASTAAAVLEQVGIVHHGARTIVLGVFAGPTFTDPTQANLERFEAARAGLDALRLPALVVGGAAVFGSDAFNEQVVQGLHAADALLG